MKLRYKHIVVFLIQRACEKRTQTHTWRQQTDGHQQHMFLFMHVQLLQTHLKLHQRLQQVQSVTRYTHTHTHTHTHRSERSHASVCVCVCVCVCVSVYATLRGTNASTRIVKPDIFYIVGTGLHSPGGKINIKNCK